jgi:hypothetical protein
MSGEYSFLVAFNWPDSEIQALEDRWEMVGDVPEDKVQDDYPTDMVDVSIRPLDCCTDKYHCGYCECCPCDCNEFGECRLHTAYV